MQKHEANMDDNAGLGMQIGVLEVAAQVPGSRTFLRDAPHGTACKPSRESTLDAPCVLKGANQVAGEFNAGKRESGRPSHPRAHCHRGSLRFGHLCRLIRGLNPRVLPLVARKHPEEA